MCIRLPSLLNSTVLIRASAVSKKRKYDSFWAAPFLKNLKSFQRALQETLLSFGVLKIVKSGSQDSAVPLKSSKFQFSKALKTTHD